MPSQLETLISGVLAFTSKSVTSWSFLFIDYDRLLCTVILRRRLPGESFAKLKILLGMVWIISVTMAAIPVHYGYYGCCSLCTPLVLTAIEECPIWHYSCGIFFGLTGTLLIIVMCLNIAVARKVDQSRRLSKRKFAANDLKLIRKVSFMLFVAFSSWSVIAFTMIRRILGQKVPTTMAVICVLVIAPANSVLNPYIYTRMTIPQQRRVARLEPTALSGFADSSGQTSVRHKSFQTD